MRSLWYKAHYAVRAAFQQVTHVITAHDGGAVTAEFAVVFPTVVAVAVLVLSMTRIVMVQLDCHDAARQAAYSVILSEQAGASTSTAQREAIRVAQRSAGVNTQVKVLWAKESFDIRTTCPVATLGHAHLPFTVVGQAQGSRHEWLE